MTPKSCKTGGIRDDSSCSSEGELLVPAVKNTMEL